MSIVKEEAQKILDKIPDDATWDDIMYEFYVRQKIEASLEAEDAGEVVTHEEVEKRYLLSGLKEV
jgi:predicted transcriptional regulator